VSERVGPRGIEPRPAGLQPAAPPATLQPLGRPGGTRTPAPRFVRPPRCHCATGRGSTREDLNLRPPRYQRGAHTGPGSWSMVGQAGLEPAIPCSQSRWDGRFPTTHSVPAPGLEPGCPEGHGVLSAARLPDSARRACASMAGGAMGYRTPTGLRARQAWTPVPAPSYPPRESNPHAPKGTASSTRSVYRFRRWACVCSRWESNPHVRRTPGLESGASASSATRASAPPPGLEPGRPD
jgi:hypothetical protein